MDIDEILRSGELKEKELLKLSEVELRELYSRMTGRTPGRFASKQEGIGRIMRARRKQIDAAER